MNLPILQSEVKTMSSREIADLCGARHNDVIATIERLFAKGLLRESRKTLREYTSPNGGRPTMVYDLTKTDTMKIVSGYSDEVRSRIIDRWQELESSQSLALPNFTDPAAAAEAWAKEYREKQALAVTLEQAKPKINFYDKVGDSKNLLIASKIGQSFKTNPMSAVALNKHLEKFDVYNMSIKSGRVFKQWFVDKGFGRMVQNDNGYPQAKFTTDGQAWIVEKFTSEGII